MVMEAMNRRYYLLPTAVDIEEDAEVYLLLCVPRRVPVVSPLVVYRFPVYLALNLY